MNLKDKTVVITGASSGIGRELALRLADEGAQLVVAARKVQALESLVSECEAKGAKATAVQTDVAEPNDCKRLIDRAVEAFGGIDVLVNNAGISMWARFDQVEDLSIFERLMKVNYLGTVHCTWHALEHLKQRKGLIVGISSLTGKTGVPTRTAYAASKHAMQGFLDSLRVELRNTGVDVLVVSPGFVTTGIRARALSGAGEALGESPRDESQGGMTTEECVQQILDAMHARRRELVMTAQGKIGLFVKLIAPRLVDRAAAKAVSDPGR